MPDMEKQLQEFVAARPGWKLHEKRDQLWGGRHFDYPGDRQALLYLLPRHHYWETGINTISSAGPEEVAEQNSLPELGKWIAAKQRVLTLPFRLAECTSYEVAGEMVRNLSAGDFATLAYVLDVDSGSSGFKCRQILDICVPNSVRRTVNV